MQYRPHAALIYYWYLRLHPGSLLHCLLGLNFCFQNHSAYQSLQSVHSANSHLPSSAVIYDFHNMDVPNCYYTVNYTLKLASVSFCAAIAFTAESANSSAWYRRVLLLSSNACFRLLRCLFSLEGYGKLTSQTSHTNCLPKRLHSAMLIRFPPIFQCETAQDLAVPGCVAKQEFSQL